MIIDFPAGSQTGRLRQLWQEAFQDPDDYIDTFFSLAFSPDRCRCVTVNGEVAAMVHWFDMTCRGRQVAYLYAVATHRDYRGRGFCRGLLEDVHGLLKDRGYAGTVLVPEGEVLAAMYGRMGYRNFGGLEEIHCRAAKEPVPLRPITAGEYNARRNALLPPGGVELGDTAVSFLASMAEFYEGEDFLLAASRKDRTLFGAELLGNAEAAPGILRALGCTGGNFRGPGEQYPFAMYRSLDDTTPPPGYFGIAFD